MEGLEAVLVGLAGVAIGGWIAWAGQRHVEREQRHEERLDQFAQRVLDLLVYYPRMTTNPSAEKRFEDRQGFRRLAYELHLRASMVADQTLADRVVVFVRAAGAMADDPITGHASDAGQRLIEAYVPVMARTVLLCDYGADGVDGVQPAFPLSLVTHRRRKRRARVWSKFFGGEAERLRQLIESNGASST